MKSNFILWNEEVYYYVSKRKNPKFRYDQLSHFVSFHETEAQAWNHAIKLTNELIGRLNDSIEEYKNNKKIKKVDL